MEMSDERILKLPHQQRQTTLRQLKQWYSFNPCIQSRPRY